MLQAQLDHPAHEVSHHMGRFEKVGSGYQGSVEFEDLTNRCVLNLLPKPLLIIAHFNFVKCFWHDCFDRLRSHILWNRLTEVAQD